MKKHIALLMALLMAVLLIPGALSGCDSASETGEPVLAITNSITAVDVDTDIAVSIENAAFNDELGADSIALSGAFRSLYVAQVVVNDKNSITIKTRGSLDQEFSAGTVAVSADATDCGQYLNASAEIDMSAINETVAGGLDYDAMVIRAIRGTIDFGWEKLPFGGEFIASTLDPTINKYLGIAEDPSISDVLNKLDEIQTQLDTLSDQLNANTNEILRNMYDELNFADFNRRLTTVQSLLQTTYAALQTIEESDCSEYTKFVRTAGLLSFQTGAESELVKETVALSKYLDGSQISGKNEKGIFEKAFLFACQDSVFGGEASQIVAPFIKNITYTLGSSYKMLAIVLNAKTYVYECREDINAEAANDEVLSAAMALVNLSDIIANNDIHVSLLSETNINSIPNLFNYYFDGEDDESILKQYNLLVMDKWFSFVRKYSFDGGDINVEFVDLDNRIDFVKPLDVGLDTSVKEDKTKAMVAQTDNTLKTFVNDVLSSEEIEKVIRHVVENKNGIFYDESAFGTLTGEDNLAGILSRYGFEFPETSGKEIFVVSTANRYDYDVQAGGMAHVTTYHAELSVNGYMPSMTLVYDDKGNLKTKFTNDLAKYYEYDYQFATSILRNETVTDDYSFLAFKAAPTEIYTTKEFVGFISSIADGHDYKNKYIELMADLDFSGEKYENVWLPAKAEKAFRGAFNGNGHTISGIHDVTPNAGGLFRTVGEGALIHDLILKDVSVEGTENKTGYGGLVGRVTGYTRIYNVRVESGKVSGFNRVGGIVGEVANGSLILSECVNFASITASDQAAGGIVGSSVSKQTQKIYLCENYGAVNAPNGTAAGGIVAYLGDTKSDQRHDIHNCKNEGDVNGGSGKTGGILGHLSTDNTKNEIYSNTNSGNISGGLTGGIIGYSEGGGNFDHNTNSGNVTGLAAGGILGENEDDGIEFRECKNTGEIKATKDAGGILAYTGTRDRNASFSFRCCENSGNISSETTYAAGICGRLNTDSKNCDFYCACNRGTVNGYTYAGGVVAWNEGGGLICAAFNYGTVISETSYAGGIIAYTVDDFCNYNQCYNYGDVTGKENVGGITGFFGNRDRSPDLKFIYCFNNGTITSLNSNAGGMAGVLSTDSAGIRFFMCKNEGGVKAGNMSAGGMVGQTYGGGTFECCENTGAISVTNGYVGNLIGYIENDKVSFIDCIADGTVTGQANKGVFVGYDGYRKKAVDGNIQ